LASRAEFVVFSGQHTIAGTLTVAPGTLASANVLAAGSLTIDNGAENDVGQFQKLNAGSFTVAAGTGLTAFVDVLGGSLYVNGTVTGDITVAAGTRLGGSGVIRGDVTVNGTFAPGNSPGITTVAAGDVTFAPGSAFEAELGGVTAGNGDGFHDQLLVQAGAINLGATAVLEAVQWAQAAPFTPVRGDVMTILRAAGGITGSFGDFVNQSYPTWLIYDNSLAAGRTEGRLFGTGLVRGQTFGDYSAPHVVLLTRIWEASVVESANSAGGGNPAGFIDSGTGTGFAALTVLSAPTIEDAIALLGPGAHLAADDYVQTVMRSLQDADRNAVAVYGEGAWSLSVGYARADHDYVGAPQSSLDHALSADTAFASLTRRIGSWSVGGFFGSNSGRTSYSAGSAEFSGVLAGLAASGRVPGRLPLDLRLSAVWADLSMDASRNTSAVSDVGVTGMGAQVWAELETWKSARWSLSPALGLTYGTSEVDGFTETGGAALIVDPFDADSLRTFAGLTLRAQATASVELSLTAGYEHELAQDSRRAHGTFVDMPAGGIYPDAATAAYDDPVDKEGTVLVTAGLGWRLPAAMTLRAGVEYRDEGEREDSLRFNVSLGRRF
jgi:cytoskeletal protein CcmA (bactofilin family)